MPAVAQDRVVRYGAGIIPDTDAVFQWRTVHATYYTPMDLRAFPFDRQQLLIQVKKQKNSSTDYRIFQFFIID